MPPKVTVSAKGYTTVHLDPLRFIKSRTAASTSSPPPAQKRKVLELDSQHGEPSSRLPPIIKKRKINSKEQATTSNINDKAKKIDSLLATADDSLKTIASTPSTPIQVPPLEVQPREQVSKRKIDTTPLHTLPAPGVESEANKNVIDWSKNDDLAFALDNVVHIYNLRNSDHYTIGYSFSCTIGAVSFDPNGHILAVGTNDLDCAENNMLHFYDPENKKLLKTLEIPAEDGKIIALAWHPVRKMISVGTSEGCIYHFDKVLFEKPDVLRVEGHHAAVYGLMWNSNGQRLASSSDDGQVRIWRKTRLAKSVYMYQNQSAVRALAWGQFEPRLLAFGGGVDGRSIHIYNVRYMLRERTYEADSRVTSLHFSDVYEDVVSIHGMPHPKICRWDYSNYGSDFDIPAHGDLILHSAINPSREKLATLSTDKTVKLCDSYSLKPLSDDFLFKEKAQE